MIIALAASRVVSLYAFYLYDDAFITFRYCANLVNGNGLVYNVGEKVQGISTPIWGFVLSIPAIIGIPLEHASRWLGLLFDLLSLVLIWKIFSREQNGYSGLLVAFLFAIDLYLAKTSVSGMEGPLFLFVTLWAVDSYMRDKLYVSALLCGLSVFVRPEGLLFASVLLLYAAFVKRRLPIGPLMVGVGLILVGASLQFLYYGQWIPQSVVGKAALVRSYEGILYLVFFPLRDPLQLVLTLTTVVGFFTAWNRSEFVRIYSLWAFVLLLAWAIFGARLWAWYCYPVWFWKALVTGVFVAAMFEKYSSLAWLKRFANPAMLCVITIFGWAMLAIVLGPSMITHNVHEKIRDWAASRDFTGKTSYGMDFGAVGYYTGMRVIDEPGLVWPDAITKYSSDLRKILLGEKPEYAFVTNYLDNVSVMNSDQISKLYQPVARFADSGDTTLAIPLDKVSQKWLHDFTAYERVE